MTSQESLLAMQEKEKQKKKEEEAKQRRKHEQEEKREAKKRETDLKVAERKRKQEERKKKVELKRQEQEEKRKQRDRGKGNKHVASEEGLQTNEITNCECVACFGLYEEDLLPNGELIEDWVECIECKKWMHSRCVVMDDNVLMACCLCGVVFH